MPQYYVKDIRATVEINSENVKRYDSKFWYYDHSHPDSCFSPEHRKELLNGIQVVLDRDTTYKSLYEESKSLGVTVKQLIALLIDQDFLFDSVNEVWHCNSVSVEQPLDLTQSYVITSAQSNTYVSPAYDTLKKYCNIVGARLIILPLYYGVSPDSESIWWADDIEDYLFKGKTTINGVQILGDLSVSVTAVNPLSGLKPLSNGMTTIIGSSHMALERIPCTPELRPAALWATGCVTRANYKRRHKTSYKAKFHHTNSAIHLSFDSQGNHHIRSLNCHSDSGKLFDINREYDRHGNFTKVNFDHVLGDIHVGFTCRRTWAGYLNFVKMFGNPQRLVLHDVLDGSTVNPHELHNPFVKFKNPFTNLSDELDHCFKFINNASKYSNEGVVVVRSNHDDFLDRWLARTDWRKLDDAETAKIYLDAASMKSRGETFDMLSRSYNNSDRFRDNVKFLKSCENYAPYNVEYGYHGDKGSSGSRGSIKQFAHMSSKFVLGHSHSSGIYKGASQNGTFTVLQLPYMKGTNKCDNSFNIVSENGKRQLIELYKGHHTGG